MLIIRAGGGRRGGAQAAERDVECRCQSRDQATKLCRVDSRCWICLAIRAGSKCLIVTTGWSINMTPASP